MFPAPRIYKRKDPVWPWGYYIPPQLGLQPGQTGCFVCDSREEAEKQVKRRQREIE